MVYGILASNDVRFQSTSSLTPSKDSSDYETESSASDKINSEEERILFDEIEKEKPQNFLINIKKYSDKLKKVICTFNKSIIYDSITLQGNAQTTADIKQKKKQRKQCIALIDSFRNLKTKKLVLKDIYSKTSFLKKTISQGSNILHR